MYRRILAGEMIVLVITVAHVEGAFGALIVYVVGARGIGHYIDLVLFSIPFYLVDSHRKMIHVEQFEFSIFISCIEYQMAVVLPLQSICADIIRLGIPYCLIPTSVLQHHGFNLL